MAQPEESKVVIYQMSNEVAREPARESDEMLGACEVELGGAMESAEEVVQPKIDPKPTKSRRQRKQKETAPAQNLI